MERGGYLQRSFFRPPPLGQLLNQLSVRGWSKKKRDEGRRGGGRSAAGGIFSHSVHRAGRAAGVIVLVLKVEVVFSRTTSSREQLRPMSSLQDVLHGVYHCKHDTFHSLPVKR